MNIPIKLTDSRCMPFRAHFEDAGADLFSTEDVVIEPSVMKMVDTGVAVSIPKGFVGLVYSRSGQGKQRISLANGTGVIDSGYIGNIKVMLENNGTSVYNIKAYDTKIAQLVIMPIAFVTFYKVDSLEATLRGSNGFGSTG